MTKPLIKILFIGNSYTQNNQLPTVFSRLAKADNILVEVDIVASGGWNFVKHAQSEHTLSVIANTQWDYIILQEQSIIPALPEERINMYAAARYLNDRIVERGAKTVFFMTWGRRDGLVDFNFLSYSAMQAALIVGYETIANELNAPIAAVGKAWKDAILGHNINGLWAEDGSHPSKKGTYLAACVLFATLFKRSPQGLDYYFGLDKALAAKLQQIAALST